MAYPTEAVWGLGCDPYNEHAFHEILRLKQRPLEKESSCWSANISQIEHLLTTLPSQMREQVIASWSNHSALNEPPRGYCLQEMKFPVGLKATILKLLSESLHTRFASLFVRPLMALLFLPVQTLLGFLLPARYKKPLILRPRITILKWRFRLESRTQPNY